MAYPYFPMCFTMCLPIKSSFFWLSHVLPEGHLAPGPAHRWHWSFTRSAQSPAIFQGNTASSSCFFFFEFMFPYVSSIQKRGYPWISCHFSVTKFEDLKSPWFSSSVRRFQRLFWGHVEFSTDSQRPDL
jgi:hypothetical protein